MIALIAMRRPESAAASCSISRNSGLREMKAAARREQQSVPRQEAHRSQIDVLVPADRRGERGARLGEGRRIEHDRVERVAGGLAFAQIVERVGLDQLDIRDAIPRAVLAGALQRIRRDVERDDGVGSAGEVERERAVIAEAIERASASAFADQHAILALIEERAGLLAAPAARRACGCRAR